MRLQDLLVGLPEADLVGNPDTPVSDICYDSRAVRPGSLFVAMRGLNVDGHDYIRQALAAGASAVAVGAGSESKWRPVVEGLHAPVLVVGNTRVALARLAAAFHGYPARRLRVIGVTGTDGKTSLCHLLAHVFNATGNKAGLISTAECRIADQLLPDTGRYTTPEAPEVQAMLAQMVAADCEWAVMEATSHGLALHRVDDCEYDIAAFTNLTSDHLDFHGSLGEYRAAKGRLFSMLDDSVDKGIAKTAILNADDPACGYFASLTNARVKTYGVSAPPDISAHSLTADGWSTQLMLRADDQEISVHFPRPGAFNVSNALAATGVALAAGLDLETIARGLESWPGAPGRMELIEEGQQFTVVVDFAHAPDSLRRVLEHLRGSSRGRIVAVFGCIGERDKDRRFAMGRVAAEHADYTIVTDDNPYSEDPDAIITEIARGLEFGGKRLGHDFAVVPDRREAIAQALAMAVDEDVVLLAGKGHEMQVHLAGSSYDCNDAEMARQVLRELPG